MTERHSQAPLAPGEVLAGKYRVERVLGVGGMGVVVQALHLELDERVAVKFLLPHAVVNAEAAARFVREARAAVRIKSEHVARVTDVGRLDNGSPYIVMEYLEGEDLGAVIQHEAPPVELAVDYVLQACLAIAEAHAAGIVHRDLKPSNLFLARRPDGSALVKVLDFGISKVIAPDRQGVSLTRTSTLMGSPLYMSPEQLRSARDVDYRTDIWSLGVILFELLTRSAPFQAETLPQLIASVLSDVPPQSLSELRPEVPPGLVAVVMRCLERDPDRRFANIGELAHALVPYASRHLRYITERLVRPSVLPPPGVRESGPPGVLPSAPPVRVGHGPSEGVRTDTAGEVAGTASAWTGSRHGARPNRTVPLLIAGSVAVLALGLIGGFVMLRPRTDAASEASTPVPRPTSALPAAAPPSLAVTPAASVVVTPSSEPPPSADPAASASSLARPHAPPSHGVQPPSSSAARTPEPVLRSQPAPEPLPRAEPAPHLAPPVASAEPKKNPLAVDLK